MEAMEKAIKENREAVELQLSSIEGMIQRLAVAWEKKSPTTNIHTAESSGGDEGTTTHEDNRWRNLEIPIFGADDPMSWLTKIERYFRLRTVREEDKLEVVMVAMDGKALGWF